MRNKIIILQDRRRAHLEVWDMIQMGFPRPSLNSHFSNFSEYALKSSENQRFSSPKFFATQKTFLNANIPRLHPNFIFYSKGEVQQ